MRAPMAQSGYPSTFTEIAVIRMAIARPIRDGYAGAGISRIAPSARAFARPVGYIRATSRGPRHFSALTATEVHPAHSPRAAAAGREAKTATQADRPTAEA